MAASFISNQTNSILQIGLFVMTNTAGQNSGAYGQTNKVARTNVCMRYGLMVENPKVTDKPVDRLHCDRCGGTSKPAAMLAKAFDHPAYKIFECETCGLLDWVTQ